MKASSYAEQRSAASQPTIEPALRLLGLRKSYGEVEAVRGIDLEVERGEIFAFLGPNGAGKTTTVEILEGFRPRSSGEVSVLGVDPADGTREWRDRIGIVLQESAPDPGLTVREALELYAGYYSQPRSVVETIALVGLEGKTRPTGNESLGRRTPPTRLRARPDRRPGTDLPRRADHRLRSLGPPNSLGRDRKPPRPRQDDLPDHALHGRGRTARRPHRRHRRRTASSLKALR